MTYSKEGYDFCGWASKANQRCADGRTILPFAFRDSEEKVPLVYNHTHDDISQNLGYAILEHTAEGTYAYGFFNNTPSGQNAKEQVLHGDLDSMSVWANELVEANGAVQHGLIKEVSLVLAGANKKARIESVIAHGMMTEDDDAEGIIYTGEYLEHAEKIGQNEKKEEAKMEDEKKVEEKTSEDSKDKTVEDIVNGMTDEQKKVTAFLIDEAVKKATETDDDNKEEDDDMKHNVFDTSDQNERSYLSHSDMTTIIESAKKSGSGSLKEAVDEFVGDGKFLSHGTPTDGMDTPTGTSTYGVNDTSMLFPDYKNYTTTPQFIQRDQGWVGQVMNGVHKTPFSRVRSVFADITEDEARAKGYIKGNQKKTEVFTTLKRVTDSTTIYKLQKMDRKDVVNITDFDVISWIKSEMRMMLNEEIARAILIGDGRQADSDDKIPEANIRPIATDVDLFNIKKVVQYASADSDDDKTKKAIRAIIKARKEYKGSGNPVFFTTEDFLTDMLLLEDGIGHKLYKTEQEAATAIRASKIVTVEAMDGYKINNKDIVGIMVNLADYNVGTDKGGEINMFDDFDLNFNRYEYLIEADLSGALTKPFSAITITSETV